MTFHEKSPSLRLFLSHTNSPIVSVVDAVYTLWMRTVGRYRLDRELGVGSFGAVFLAHATDSGQPFALKFLKGGEHGPTPEQILRFKAEFAILTTLQHPNIARIAEFGVDPHTQEYFFAGEFIDGVPLTRALLHASADVVEDRIVQALRALEFLHARTVFHFDLKPGNLLVTPDGTLKVIDFGLANLPGEMLAGTPSYMAPEICARAKRDGRADLYALGVIWYQCLTGVNPFRGHTMQETLDRHLHHTHAPIDEVRPGLPSHLQPIIIRLLAKNPLHRYTRAADVIRDLNYRGGTSHRIETEATRHGYLPEVGTLIGRTAQWETFREGLAQPKDLTPPFPILLVSGAPGCGKTRFCTEARYHAQIQDRALVVHDTDRPLDAARLGDLRVQATHGEAATHPDLMLIALLPHDAETLSRWLPEDRVHRIDLTPFTTADVLTYLQHVTGLTAIPETLVTAIHQRTDGNPRLVRELLAACLAKGTLRDDTGHWTTTAFLDLQREIAALPLPTALADWLHARWETVPTSLRGVLELMSLCEQDVPHSAVVQLTGLAPESLAPLVSDGWITTSGQMLTINNPAVREWLHATMPVKTRMHWHDRILQSFALFPDESENHHRIYASDVDDACVALDAHLPHLMREERWNEATAALRWLWQRLSVQSGPRHIDIGIRWLDVLIESGNGDQFTSTRAMIENAIAQLPSSTCATALRALQLKDVEWHLHRHELDAAATLITGLLRTPSDLPATEILRLKNYHGRILWERDELDAAAALLRATWHDSARLSEPEQQRVTNNDLGLVLLSQGRHANAIAHFRGELTRPHAVHDPYLAARCRYNLGEVHLQLHQYAEADAELQQAYAMTQPLGRPELLLRILNGLGNVASARGETAQAIASYQRGLHLAERLGDRSCTAALSTNIGILLHHDGRNNESVSHLQHTEHLLHNTTRSAADESCLQRCREELASMESSQHEGEQGRRSDSGAIVRGSNNRNATALRTMEENMPTQPAATTSEGWKQLFAITQQLARETDVPHLLEQILGHAVTLAGAEIGMVLLLDDHDTLTVQSVLNITPDTALQAASTTIAKRAIAANTVLCIDDAVQDTQFREEASVMVGGLRSICCIPIHALGQVIGCLYLSHQHHAGAFRAIDRELLAAFADQAGIAIERTRRLMTSTAKAAQLEHDLAERDSELSKLEAQMASQAAPNQFRLKDLQSANPAMGKLFTLVGKILPTDLSVFLHGETGTGKEVLARLLHTHHPQRGKGPFIAICCGAIPKELMESELFGYKAGAFTGATRDKAGLFEAAHGGTLLLDEVAELPLELQAKLLRVLQEQEVRRLGETSSRKFNCRILSASHKNLRQMVTQGSFREDLLFRLCQIQIDIPALRERLEDLPALVEHFITHYCTHHKIRTAPRVARDVMKRFLSYNWPGNIRELENMIQAMCALSDGKTLRMEDIPPHYAIGSAFEVRSSMEQPRTSNTEPRTTVPIDRHNLYDPTKTWDDYEYLIIAMAYRHYHFDAAATAQALQVSRAKLYKLIKAMDLKNPAHRLYQESFTYTAGMTLRDYTVKIFTAALLAAGNKPYTAIRALAVSPGYFYKMKGVGAAGHEEGQNFR